MAFFQHKAKIQELPWKRVEQGIKRFREVTSYYTMNVRRGAIKLCSLRGTGRHFMKVIKNILLRGATVISRSSIMKDFCVTQFQRDNMSYRY